MKLFFRFKSFDLLLDKTEIWLDWARFHSLGVHHLHYQFFCHFMHHATALLQIEIARYNYWHNWILEWICMQSCSNICITSLDVLSKHWNWSGFIWTLNYHKIFSFKNNPFRWIGQCVFNVGFSRSLRTFNNSPYFHPCLWENNRLLPSCHSINFRNHVCFYHDSLSHCICVG